MSAPLLTPTFFGPARDLFAWVHAPEGAPRAAAVLCPPLGYEYICTHRAMRAAAEALSAAGALTVRFDYRGTGDSAGTPGEEDLTPGFIESVRAALALARERAPGVPLVLVGLRMGAALAAVAAAEEGGVDGLVLWSPCATGKGFLREQRALHLMNQARAGVPEESVEAPQREGAVGFAFSSATAAGLRKIELAKLGKKTAAQALLIERDDRPAEDALAAALTAAGAQLERDRLPGTPELLQEPLFSVVPRPALARMARFIAERFGGRAPAGDELGCSHAREPGASGALSEGASALREEPVFFGPSDRLFGIITEPIGGPARKSGVLLLNTGGDHHVGPNRLYSVLARRWAAQGYAVLRFDLSGLGDSEAEPGAPANLAYPRSCVADVEQALAVLARRCAAGSVALGLCSGGYTALRAALEGVPLAGLVSANLLVFWDGAYRVGSAADRVQASARPDLRPPGHVDPQQMVGGPRRGLPGHEPAVLGRTVLNKATWRKLFKGGYSFGRIRSVLTARAQTVARGLRDRLAARLGLGGAEIARALRALTDRAPLELLLLYSEGDLGLDFLMERAAPMVDRLSRRPNFRLVTIPGADHTFTSEEAQRRLADALTAHLLERHP